MNDLMWIDIIAYVLQFMLIAIAVVVVLQKNNSTIVLLVVAFSLVVSGLYVINHAPDVAIAEVAIGAAIIPLIYVISISRQREFIVLDRAMDDFIISNNDFTGIGYVLLKRFTDYYHLELNICNDPGLCSWEAGPDKVICEKTNVDLIVSRDEEKGVYQLKGKESSLLMTKLAQMAEDYDDIEVHTFTERGFGE